MIGETEISNYVNAELAAMHVHLILNLNDADTLKLYGSRANHRIIIWNKRAHELCMLLGN